MSEMLASVVAYVDLQVFLFINHLPHTMLTDTLALTVSGVGKGGLVFILIGALLFMREERKDHRFFLMVTAGLSLGWILSEAILKPWFEKPRPYLSGPWGYAVIVDTAATGYSFPSTHAVIAWSLAVILSVKVPRWRWGLFALAAFISLSRIFLGVHFPADVFAGSILGWAIGRGILFVFRHQQKVKKILPQRSGTRRKL